MQRGTKCLIDLGRAGFMEVEITKIDELRVYFRCPNERETSLSRAMFEKISR